jgi:DNA-binding FrmR family transcriptional regulator
MADGIHDVQLQVGLLEKDVKNQDKQCSVISQKLTASIEKLQEVNLNVVKMITIHDLKHEQHEKTEGNLKEDVKDLHVRISAVNKEMQDKLVVFENNISEKIDDLKLILTINPPEDKKKGLMPFFVLDKYAYLMIGGLVVIGWLFFHISDIQKVFKLF